MTSSKKRSAPDNISSSDIFQSSTIEDRSSTFIAHFSPSIAGKTLQAQPEFESASHRVLSWRKPSKQKAIFGAAPAQFDTGFDDDGERYAGKKVLGVLESMKVEGSIVVARWYGGVLLGPVRFTHIEKVAKEAVQAWQKSKGMGTVVSREAGPDVKRAKTEDVPAQRKRLLQELPERDESIMTLRALLAQKRGEEEDAPQSSAPKTPTRVVDYTRMPLEALKKLERARDSTILFLLKSINEAEKKVKDKTLSKEFEDWLDDEVDHKGEAAGDG